jgi:8-oxo-dGTP pyrophosphatase MutT (NUDIX family)
VAGFNSELLLTRCQTPHLVNLYLSNMFIRIYFNDKPLFLCDSIDDIIEPYLHHDDAVFIDELNPHTVKSMIHEMELDKVHAGIFQHTNLEELKKAFFKKFTIIIAAGGMVMNEKQEILMIFRKGKWDLPKGKLDKGESIETCALREVKEETGLSHVEPGPALITTYHTYHEGTRFILKESHWFNMTATSDQPLIPQTEEDITEIKWVSREHIPEYLPLSFPSVKDVLKLSMVY